MSLSSTISISESEPSSDGESTYSRSSSPSVGSCSSSSDSSPRNSPTVLRASCSRNIDLKVFLGRPNSTSFEVRGDKENLEVVVLKVVPVVTMTRTFEGSQFWVAVAVGDHKSKIGIGEHVAKSEALATRKAQKKAYRNLREVKLFEERTVKGRVTGWSGGVCASIVQAPRGTVIISTSGMARRLLQLAGMKDCYIKNVLDKLTTVRALKKALAKLR